MWNRWGMLRPEEDAGPWIVGTVFKICPCQYTTTQRQARRNGRRYFPGKLMYPSFIGQRQRVRPPFGEDDGTCPPDVLSGGSVVVVVAWVYIAKRDSK